MLNLWGRLKIWWHLRRHRRNPPVIPPTRLEDLLDVAEAAVRAVDVLKFRITDALQEGLLVPDHTAVAAMTSLDFSMKRTRDELKIEARKQ